MLVKELTPFLSVSPQLSADDIAQAAKLGFKSIINNRPDGEEQIQPTSTDLAAAAKSAGLEYRYIPVISGHLIDEDVNVFRRATSELKGPVLAFCRTGTRSSTLWTLSESAHIDADVLIGIAASAGYDLSSLRPALIDRNAQNEQPELVDTTQGDVQMGRAHTHDIVVVGGGAAGIAVTASLLARKSQLDIAIIEPSDVHYYQPGWTLVGGGVFSDQQTIRDEASVIPKKARWIHAAATSFKPESNTVILENGERVIYKTLIVAPGLKLDWDAIPGLHETLGKNGVTSNYKQGLAPYTWELIKSLGEGAAIFTQPPMPIKCAGAPQKAMYLACDHWRRKGTLKNIDVAFHNAGNVLFGVAPYVPALMKYVSKYDIDLALGENLVAVDGANKTATFEWTDEAGNPKRADKHFNFMHVCPPQSAPDFVRDSPLSNEAGWVDVDPETLQHVRYDNIYSLGDVCSAPNAKTAAAVRSQAPVVAKNIIHAINHEAGRALYNGYGSCPLTVERGKIVLAEFGYGGKIMPTLPFIDGTTPSRMAWFLKEKLLPWIYWNAMLKGREWLVKYGYDANRGHAAPDKQPKQ